MYAQSEIVPSFIPELIMKNQSNEQISFNNINQWYDGQFKISTIGYYIPYNNEYNDKGWGCAWRVIQMLLGSIEQSVDFGNFYKQYCKKQCLMQICKQLYQYNPQILDRLDNSKWIPEFLLNHWAEPFIGKLVFYHYKMQHKHKLSIYLILLNGYPKSNAPSIVYEQTINFSKFIQILQKYLAMHPVMIDDGIICLLILGLQYNSQQQIVMLIADPHILTNRSDKHVGLYTVTLTNEGKQISHSVTQKQEKEFYCHSFKNIIFFKKQWMILYLCKE